jgi:riboflavin biosynthesis pyrimidine reductase
MRVEEIERLGGRVIIAGSASVDGALLVKALAALGYRTIYSAAGPRILHLLVTSGALDFLYVTAANRLLGGMKFAALLDGPLLDPPVGARIRHIYLVEQALDGLGQMYLSYQFERTKK